MLILKNPQAAGAAMADHLGRRFTATISGLPGSGKTTALAHIAAAAVGQGLGIHEIAVFAPTRMAGDRQRALIGELCFPGVPPHDVFDSAVIGVPIDAARMHTLLRQPIVSRPRAAAREFLDLIKRVGDLGDNDTDRAFLQSRRHDIERTIQIDTRLRLRGEDLPPFAPLHEIADFYRAYKAQHGLIDVADLYRGPLAVAGRVRLLLMDDIGNEARTMLARVFPNASTVASGNDLGGGDPALQLTQCLRRPARWEIASTTGRAAVIPSNDLPNSLLILLARLVPWRLATWGFWCSRAGLAYRIGGRPESPDWRAVVAAWQLDQGEEVEAQAINRLLAAAGLTALDDEGLLTRADIPGWKSWRHAAARAPAWVLPFAENVLARYGRLTELPMIRITTPWRARGIEADTVIVDGFAPPLGPSDYALAVTRATRRLILFQGERRALAVR